LSLGQVGQTYTPTQRDKINTLIAIQSVIFPF
jgi:hypothetical protein